MSNFSIKDKIIVVTGAGGYIGKKLCEDLSQCGATIIAFLRSDCDFINPNITKIFCDLADDIAIKNAFKQVEADFKRIDVLVNNAYYGSSKSWDCTNREDWFYTTDGCIAQLHECVKISIPLLLKSNSARIINIASMYGMVAPNKNNYPSGININPITYGVAKAGLIQYSKYMAMILSDKNILVNSISYGAFPNPEANTNNEFISNLTKDTMLGRIGKLADVTAPIYFLAMPENAYMTGQNITIDGGWTAW